MTWTPDDHSTGTSPLAGEVPPVESGGVSGRVVDAVQALDARSAALLDLFLRASDSTRALVAWLALTRPEVQFDDPARVARLIARDLVAIDRLLSRQLDAVLHHPRFQRLEATWRGLRYLVDRIAEHGAAGATIKLRLLDASWRDLSRDLERAADFDQSTLFRKVYEDEFGSPGGEPYGVLLGDYEVRLRASPDHPIQDVDVLSGISQVAAAAFSPFIVGAHPSLLALDSFRELEIPRDLSKTFDDPMYVRWNAFRKREDSRFLAVTVPRVLMRAPYRAASWRKDGFSYTEDVSDPSGDALLWGTAVYAFGAVLARSFQEYSWLADIRGVPGGRTGGGVVENLPSWSFSTERPELVRRSSTDVIVAERLEADLTDLGFVALCQAAGQERSAFFGVPSVQLPQRMATEAATVNARLSSMLPYVLCVARVAHFVKMIGRNKVGSYATAKECQAFLQGWLAKYCTSSDRATNEQRARAPLAQARVEVLEHPGKPGCYRSVIHVRPHFQLDQLATTVRLVTEFAPVGGG